MMRHLLRRGVGLGLARRNNYSNKRDSRAWRSLSRSLSTSRPLSASLSASLSGSKDAKGTGFGDWLSKWREGRDQDEEDYPFPVDEAAVSRHADVLVVGGGAIGCSVAYWLKKRVFHDMNVVVVERDPTYSKASTSLSVGGLRQQFSLEENIEMSLFGASFIRNLGEHLMVDRSHRPCAQFHPYGYLTLASTPASAELLSQNSQLQRKLGAKNVLLSPESLSAIFPWMQTGDLELGCLGLEKEGWFDPWLLLCALKRKAAYLGAEFVHGEVVGCKTSRLIDAPVGDDDPACEKVSKVVVKRPDGSQVEIEFAVLVIAAGAFSADIARMARIGVGTDVDGVPLPVEPRKRYVYCVHCPEGPGLNTPLTIDPTGTYFRRDGLGGNYICGRSPSADEEPPVDDLSVDHDYFEEKVWPALARRAKAFENLKVKSAWAGYYEYNWLDRNGIVGRHPVQRNVMLATGFSGHGIQQAPAVGRAIAELIIDSRYTTIDLTRLGFDRVVLNSPVYEANIF